MKSTLYSVNWKDSFKGLIIAIGTPVFTLLQQLIPTWTPFLSDHLGKTGGIIAQAALAAFVTYIIKNFFTDNTTEAIKILAPQNVTITEDTTQKVVTPENVKEVQKATQPSK